MPKLTNHFIFHELRNQSLAVLFVLPILLSTIWGQTPDPAKTISRLPDRLGANFALVGKIQTLSAGQCAALPDGDVYKEFELEGL